jgi:Tol biopolymer transport system component
VALTLLLAPGLAPPARAGAAGAPTGPDAIVFAQSSNQGAWEIWAIRPGDPSPRPVLQRDGISFENPSWSPDGTQIAFRKQVSMRVWRVMVMRADGTDIRVVTSRSPLGAIQWSPDGTRLAFASQVDGIAQIFTVDVSGANLEQVTDELTSSTEPLWSHDGARLYHQSQEPVGPQNRLYAMQRARTARR